MQYGALGVAGLSLGILSWLVRVWRIDMKEGQDKANKQTERCATVIEGNTAALQKLSEAIESDKKVGQELHNRLLSRPCLREEA